MASNWGSGQLELWFEQLKHLENSCTEISKFDSQSSIANADSSFGRSQPPSKSDYSDAKGTTQTKHERENSLHSARQLIQIRSTHR